MTADEEALVVVCILVDADGQDCQVGLVVMQLKQRRQLFHAGFTPTGPEVDQHHFAPVVGEMNRSGSIGDGKVGSLKAGLRRVCAAVAARDQKRRDQYQ